MHFTHPWFLVGLLLLGVPIYLHLFELRKAKKLQFTNVGFLREAQLTTAKQRRIQDWLVLFIRLLLILLVVFAFAQPQVGSKAANAHENASTVTLALDTSPSMHIREEASADAAVDVVQDVVRQLSAGLSNARSVTVLAGEKQYSINAVNAAAINDVLVNDDVQGGVAAGLAKLRTQAGFSNGQLFICSDFQKSNLDVRKLSSLPASAIELVVAPNVAAGNAYVDSLYVADEFIRPNTAFNLHVLLRNGGQESVENVAVKIFNGETLAATFTATIPANETSKHVVQMRVDGAQAQACRVEITDPVVAFDNRYYFLLYPANTIDVASVGQIDAGVQRVYANEDVFRYASTPTLSAEGVAAKQLVILQGGRSLSEPEIGVLREYVKNGGTLAVIPSADAASQRSYEQLFAELGLSSVRWASRNAGSEELRFPDLQNPFFAEVFLQQTRQADMPSAVPVLNWSRSHADILKFKNGNAFLSSFKSGEGMVYVFAAPFGRAYSSFAEHPLFVPVMYRLATSSYRARQLPAYRVTDRTLALQLPKLDVQGQEPVFRLEKDSLAVIPAQQLRNGKLYLQLPAGVQEPGFYKLRLGDQTVTTLALNADKAESELSFYSADELRQLTKDLPNVRVYEAGQGQKGLAQLTGGQESADLWRWCLLGALLCLLAEALVIRFGRTRRATTAQAA